MAAEWIEPAKFFVEVAKVGIAIGTGVWAYHRFIRERTHAPQIEFDVDCSFQGPQAGAYVVEVTLKLLNKGLTRQEIKDIRLRVRGIKRGDKLSYWPSREPRLQFPEKVFIDSNIIPERFGYIFVEPKVNQFYKYISCISEDISFIVINAEFIYNNGDEHSAEQVFEVKIKTAAAHHPT